MRLTCAALAVLAFPFAGNAEPLEPTPGYFLGCDAEGNPIFCYVAAAGFTWAISGDRAVSELFDQLAALPLLEPVVISGSYETLNDSSADLDLTGLTRPGEDLYVGNLRAMQGRWQPKGEETPFEVEIAGLDWIELVQAEVAADFSISVGEACADGVVPGGMAISLYRYGDDPGADACWQLEYIDDATMTLRDFMGDQGQVEFTHLPSSY